MAKGADRPYGRIDEAAPRASIACGGYPLTDFKASDAGSAAARATSGSGIDGRCAVKFESAVVGGRRVNYLGRDPHGKKRRKWFSHPTRRAAEGHLTPLLAQMPIGGGISPTRLRLAEFLEDRLRDYAGGTWGQ